MLAKFLRQFTARSALLNQSQWKTVTPLYSRYFAGTRQSTRSVQQEDTQTTLDSQLQRPQLSSKIINKLKQDVSKDIKQMIDSKGTQNLSNESIKTILQAMADQAQHSFQQDGGAYHEKHMLSTNIKHFINGSQEMLPGMSDLLRAIGLEETQWNASLNNILKTGKGLDKSYLESLMEGIFPLDRVNKKQREDIRQALKVRLDSYFNDIGKI